MGGGAGVVPVMIAVLPSREGMDSDVRSRDVMVGFDPRLGRSVTFERLGFKHTLYVLSRRGRCPVRITSESVILVMLVGA